MDWPDRNAFMTIVRERLHDYDGPVCSDVDLNFILLLNCYCHVSTTEKEGHHKKKANGRQVVETAFRELPGPLAKRAAGVRMARQAAIRDQETAAAIRGFPAAFTARAAWRSLRSTSSASAISRSICASSLSEITPSCIASITALVM